MRTLNRPMFRYGGPIKEGIMNGIREPKQNGGTIAGGNQMGMPMGNRTGFADPVKAGGYFANLGSKAMNLFNPLKKLKFVNKLKSKITPIPKTRTKYQGYSEYGPVTYNTQKIPMLERIKMFAKANPKTTIGGAYVASPAVVGAATSIPYEKAIKQVGDLLVPDFIFDQDEYFAKKEKEERDAKNTTTLNTDIKKLLEQPTKSKKSEKELRAEQIAKYRDIVDIKGMNKNAAYDALIAASQAVLGEGDIKSSLKDGSLINKIIGSTSRAYDKPAKTKDAIDTLILKGEIEKDMNKDKNAIMDEYRMKQIALADKQLSGGDFSENKALFAKNMSGQQLFDNAAAKSSPNFMGNLINKKGLTDLMTEAKKSGDIVERDIIINATEELIKGKGIPNGDYTVGDVLVTIVDSKVANVTR
jgi:hypothetical protein